MFKAPYYYCSKCKKWYESEHCIKPKSREWGYGKGRTCPVHEESGVVSCIKIMQSYNAAKKKKVPLLCDCCDNRFICVTGID